MESKQDGSDRGRDAEGRAKADEALSVLASDRASLADRVKTPRWYNPLLAAAIALFIATPAVSDSSYQSMVIVFGVLLLVTATMGYQKTTGVTISRPSGPRSLGLVVILGIIVLLLLGASGVLAANGRPEWIGATAAAGFCVMWIGSWQYDRVYDRELRHGR